MAHWPPEQQSVHNAVSILWNGALVDGEELSMLWWDGYGHDSHHHQEVLLSM